MKAGYCPLCEGGFCAFRFFKVGIRCVGFKEGKLKFVVRTAFILAETKDVFWSHNLVESIEQDEQKLCHQNYCGVLVLEIGEP